MLESAVIIVRKIDYNLKQWGEAQLVHGSFDKDVLIIREGNETISPTSPTFPNASKTYSSNLGAYFEAVQIIQIL